MLPGLATLFPAIRRRGGHFNTFFGGDLATGNVVAGNTIGSDLTGFANLGNQGAGVLIQGARSNTIGGTTASAGNLITNSGGPGVQVTYLAIGNTITSNRMFGNNGKPIDLDGAGRIVGSPILVSTVDGRLEGRLAKQSPSMAFLLQFFASAGYRPDGTGEAEVFLGSMTVTTDSKGQAVFDVPFSLPPDLPVLTATATDPQGNTSEASAVREGVLDVPGQSPQLIPGQPLTFSAASVNRMALRDPSVGQLDPAWDLTLSVSAGTLTLSQTVGLTGSGDGTGLLAYQGPLSCAERRPGGDGLHASRGVSRLGDAG